MKAQAPGNCARGDKHWDRPESARFWEEEDIAWSFVGGGWAHEVCVVDEAEPEEFATVPRWQQS